MQGKLVNYYQSIITPDITTPEDSQKFLARLKLGKLTKAENPNSHCCVMLLPFDPDTNKILVVHHKKANSWFFPGGHVEPGELPIQSAIREAGEEIGLVLSESDLVGPFGVQTLAINNPPQVCREHYDVFYGIPTHPAAVTVDMREFHTFDWLTIEEAKQRITMPYYLSALAKFVRFQK